MRSRLVLCAAFWLLPIASSAHAERLTLSFLPPDFPPSNVCNAEPEQRDAEEIQETLPEDAGPITLDNEGRIAFLTRDIRDLTDRDADRWFDYIISLIARRAELDADFTDIDQDFARIDVFLAAERFDALRSEAIVNLIANRVDELSNNQKVRLAWFYRNGIGVDADLEFAEELVATAAYGGNAEALMEVVRMQLAGDSVENWDIPVEETATLAFGGMIGRLNRGLCDRAERMAREYIDGEILTPNPDLAYAWRKFAADMGGGEAAWRVVEHQLNAEAAAKDNEELLRYLSLAVENGYVIDQEDLDSIEDSGAATEAEIRQTLGYNYNRAGVVYRRSAVPYLELSVNLAEDSISDDGEYLRYLREIAAMPGTPGPVFTRLAKEILLRRGRWAGEAEAIEFLELAIKEDDPDAMIVLAEILVRQRNNIEASNRVENLLLDAVSRHSKAEALKSLDDLYRCRLPDAPLVNEAQHWAEAYRTSDISPVDVTATDLAKFDSGAEPEAVAKLQSLALLGHAGSTADLLQLLQSDPLSSDEALRFWATRVSRSDQALEEYVKQEYEHALSFDERQNAIELYRRAYLDIGAAISLDLAVTLVKHAGRDPAVAAEIQRLLTLAGQRGEGASIRLLQRLTGRDGAEVYRNFADAIERRGDFLALMFAARHVSDETFNDYMARAVSVMNCSSKDVAELADAFAIRNLPELAYHWLSVGLAMEGGHVLSKLGLSDRQTAEFDRGNPVSLQAAGSRNSSESELETLRRRFVLFSQPDRETFNPEVAAQALFAIIERSEATELDWALAAYRRADRRLQRKLDEQLDILAVFEKSAAAGDSNAQYELAMLLRKEAVDAESLANSAKWMLQAAEAGHDGAMVEYAFATGFGLGMESDPKLALVWLHKASSLGNRRASELIKLFNAMAKE